MPFFKKLEKALTMSEYQTISGTVVEKWRVDNQIHGEYTLYVIQEESGKQYGAACFFNSTAEVGYEVEATLYRKKIGRNIRKLKSIKKITKDI